MKGAVGGFCTNLWRSPSANMRRKMMENDTQNALVKGRTYFEQSAGTASGSSPFQPAQNITQGRSWES